MSRNEVSVDRLGRVSLEFRVHKRHKLYIAEESSPSGIIIFTPGALVPAKLVEPPEEWEMPGGNPLSADELKERLREMPLWKEKT